MTTNIKPDVSAVTEFTETMKEEVAAQEAALNRVLELLKSKNLSKEELERLWEEAYPKAVSVLDYKIKMGQLIAETPEGKKGPKNSNAPVGSTLSKKEVYEALGLTRKQSDDYQLISINPKAVELAKLKSIKYKCLPTVYLVKKLITTAKNAQKQASSTGTNQVADNKTKTSTTPRIFENNMQCTELPSGCNINDFVNTTIDTLKKESSYTGKTYIYFEVSQDKLLEYFEKLKEIFNEVEGGIGLKS